MKLKVILLLNFVLLVGICFPASAQDEPIHVTFFGSSVCLGFGADDSHGYAWQLFHSGAIDTVKYKYFNASTGGDNTIRVEKEARLTDKLFPTSPNIVVIGLSLGNEGIGRPMDENSRERILEQFRSRLLALADSLDHLNIKSIIVNCYAHGRFTQADYEITKRMNRILNTWNYPSVNVLGAIDDFEGRWVEGYTHDPLHPNTEGHEEMSYTIVPSLFDALLEGKKTPVYDWNGSYTTLVNESKIERPLSMMIDNTLHSFTMSFRVKNAESGSIAGFVSNNVSHTINLTDNTLLYKGLTTSYANHSDNWTHVVLTHSYANQKTMLFVNGELIGSVDEQLSPEQVYFGGTSPLTELKDLALHRSSLNASEALDLFNKKFIQSSLEFYNPLTKSFTGNQLENYAQSMSTLNAKGQVSLQYKNVPF